MATSLRRRGGTERARTTTPLTTAPGRSDRRAVALTVAVAAVVVVGVALRFLTSSHLWLDEALTVNIAKLPLSRIPDALRHDGSPPLYYLLLHWWIAAFGAGDIAVRALSASCGKPSSSIVARVATWSSSRSRCETGKSVMPAR